VGPAVIAGGDIFVLNAGGVDSLLRVHLPPNVCALFNDEAECHKLSGCVFCNTASQINLTSSYCYPATDSPPAEEYVNYLLTDCS